jgi:hypothetical protein
MDKIDPPPTLKDPNDLIPEDDPVIVAWAERNRGYLRNTDYRKFKQMPILSPLWGCDEEWYRQRVTMALISGTMMAGRRLTSDERSLFLHLAARGVVQSSYALPITAGATLAFYFAGRSTYRFPLYEPTFNRFDPNHFPSRSWSLLRGRLAGMAWQGVRAGSYGLVGMGFFRVVADPIGTYLMEKSMLDAVLYDPGLQKMCDDYTNKYKDHFEFDHD